MPPRPFASDHRECISRLARGESEQDVAKNMKKSRSWVQKIKRHPDYQVIYDSFDIKKQFREAARDLPKPASAIALARQKIIEAENELDAAGLQLRKIKLMQQSLEDCGFSMLNLSMKCLDVLAARAEELTPEEISASRITTYMSGLGISIEKATGMLAQALQTEELAREIGDRLDMDVIDV